MGTEVTTAFLGLYDLVPSYLTEFLTDPFTFIQSEQPLYWLFLLKHPISKALLVLLHSFNASLASMNLHIVLT